MNSHWFEKGDSFGRFAPYYFSVTTFTTLGFGDITPKPSATCAQMLVTSEVLIGYIMLGGFVTILSGKLVR